MKPSVKLVKKSNKKRFYLLSLILVSVISLLIFTVRGKAQREPVGQDLSQVSMPNLKDQAYYKFDSQIARIAKEWKNTITNKGSAQAVQSVVDEVMKESSLPANADKIEVWIKYDSASFNEQLLLNEGVEKDDHYAVLEGYIQAFVHIASLENISNLPGVLQVMMPPTGHPSTTSEGVARVNAQNYTNAGFRGQGIKVAILDLGFVGYSSLLGTELPSSVTVRSFFNSTSGNGDITGGGEIHGTACAEIVHDMAPDAQLYLVNYNSLAEMSAAVDYLKSQGVKVITHSVGFSNSSFYDGNGPVSDIVTSARNSGILWVNSAGNSAQGHWEGYFSDSDGDDFNEFSSNPLDETINVNVTAGEYIKVFLTWDDWNYSTNDYDLYLYFGSPLQVVASSTGFQTGLQNPTEQIIYKAPESGTYHIVIKRPFFANTSLKFELFVQTHDLAEHQVRTTSLTDPAPSSNSFTVGAMRYDSNTIESFSSLGPTTRGNRKPDIAGPDGVLTATYVNYEGRRFSGTSASTPHVAGAAALVWSQNTSRTASDVQTILQSNATDFGPSGPDDIYGYGLLNLPSVTQGGNAPNPVVTSSLTITPPGPYVTGNTLTAQFTITNKGNASITFNRLVAGGRLNGDNTCAGGCPDFSFTNGVTLAPGASYTYTGTQTVTRTGSYGFFVAYQKTDGTWVTNVPADAGVSNTASITVGSSTTAANPVLTSSVAITPPGPYFTGNALTAQFTLTNKGGAPITLKTLTLGGRLNGDNTCAGGCPDFSFANNITLNPGASYNYTGTQTVTRVGTYGFFVAYQKQDGSWVTNVPTDPGIANTATITVSQGGTAPNPVVTSSLTISPPGPYCSGSALTAQFTITNKGNAPITFSRLLAGGRLNNDQTGAGGFPDFPFASVITLNPGASYNYTATQTVTRTGNYSFFVAYQKTDGSWVTSVPADPGLTNTANLTVGTTCGSGANPVVTSSLTLSPFGPYLTGNTLTAQFTITNKGTTAITFNRLGVGGRLNNDQTGAGGFPDFPFATGITLNPGSSYTFTGSQTVTRAGDYGFFIAYQRTDGSWVTSVPTDPGVINAVNISVSSNGAANPVVTASLTISPAGPYFTGNTLTAQFTITNKGSAPITFNRLLAGGRLNNDQTGAGGFPDFPFVSGVTLNPGASYSYSGAQTVTRAGSYSFFVAYQRTDGGWITSVPTDAGLTNTVNLTVSQATGTPNPVVSSSLTISPAGPYFTGSTLTARFTITNRGTGAITFSRLVAGGRLNGDNTCAGGCPDFTFDTGVTLNPGASYSYTGTQLMSRAGTYGFFVAYQKTDGSWVTNVPTDAGITNTASITVSTQTTGTPNPVVSSSLTISPAGPYFTGDTLTARFTITNRGNGSITFSRLVAGGRLNGDNTCAGGCPDFTFDTGVTLSPGASYSYTGTQLMSRAGTYSFYVAYQKTDGTWVTNVPTDPGIINSVSISVATQVQTVAWEFNTNGNAEGWTASNASATNVTGGTYLIDPSGNDPFLVSPSLSLQATTYQWFIVRMASNGLDSTGAVYFKTQAENFFSEDKKVVFTVSNCALCGNAGAVRYAVYMPGNSKWTGTITGLRLDPTGSGQAGTNTDSIGIDYIRVSSSSLASNQKVDGMFSTENQGTLSDLAVNLDYLYRLLPIESPLKGPLFLFESNDSLESHPVELPFRRSNARICMLTEVGSSIKLELTEGAGEAALEL